MIKTLKWFTFMDMCVCIFGGHFESTTGISQGKLGNESSL